MLPTFFRVRIFFNKLYISDYYFFKDKMAMFKNDLSSSFLILLPVEQGDPHQRRELLIGGHTHLP
jgi:hypothetical protein